MQRRQPQGKILELVRIRLGAIEQIRQGPVTKQAFSGGAGHKLVHRFEEGRQTARRVRHNGVGQRVASVVFCRVQRPQKNAYVIARMVFPTHQGHVRIVEEKLKRIGQRKTVPERSQFGQPLVHPAFFVGVVVPMNQVLELVRQRARQVVGTELTQTRNFRVQHLAFVAFGDLTFRKLVAGPEVPGDVPTGLRVFFDGEQQNRESVILIDARFGLRAEDLAIGRVHAVVEQGYQGVQVGGGETRGGVHVKIAMRALAFQPCHHVERPLAIL